MTSTAFHPRLAQLAAPGSAAAGVPIGAILRLNNGGVYVTDEHLFAGSDLITYRLLPEAFTQPKIVPIGSILHTEAAGSRASNDSAWNNAAKISDLEAHVYGPDMDSGAVLQAMPLNVRADSDSDGNAFWNGGQLRGNHAYETQDNGGATLNDTPWTYPQLGTMVALLTAAHFTYRMFCTEATAWNDGGISPHNRWPQWSKAAHSCPGTARTRQMDAVRSAVASRLAKIYSDVGEDCPHHA